MILIWSLWIFLVAGHDLRRRRVPNWLVLFGAAFACITLLMNAQPFGIDWLSAIAGAAVGFGFLLIFYATGLMGAGDVKFAGALGLWVGLQALLPIWIGASLLAGVHAVVWLALRRWPYFPAIAIALSGTPVASNDEAGPQKRQRHIPFAAYLAIASIGWLVSGSPKL
ncbi:A24 family peptidase [Variovorax boronicumulans]|uniref:A24 family peptidase n=1 Tax=Variovorax boronicumulans TaxID=436515 RepID=UPI001C594CAC